MMIGWSIILQPLTKGGSTALSPCSCMGMEWNMNLEVPWWCGPLEASFHRKILWIHTCSWLLIQRPAQPRRLGPKSGRCWHGPSKPLQKGSPFFEARGRPLAGNLRAIVWAIEGDHDFFTNSLYLPHWKNWNPCWQCDATQAGGEKPFQTLDMDIFTEVDHAWASTWPTSHHPLFTEVDGVSSRMVRGDPALLLLV